MKKKHLHKTFLNFKKLLWNIQTVGYDGMHTIDGLTNQTQTLPIKSRYCKKNPVLNLLHKPIHIIKHFIEFAGFTTDQ